jgi:hypothetical protein
MQLAGLGAGVYLGDGGGLAGVSNAFGGGGGADCIGFDLAGGAAYLAILDVFASDDGKRGDGVTVDKTGEERGVDAGEEGCTLADDFLAGGLDVELLGFEIGAEAVGGVNALSQGEAGGVSGEGGEEKEKEEKFEIAGLASLRSLQRNSKFE